MVDVLTYELCFVGSVAVLIGCHLSFTILLTIMSHHADPLWSGSGAYFCFAQLHASLTFTLLTSDLRPSSSKLLFVLATISQQPCQRQAAQQHPLHPSFLTLIGPSLQQQQ